MSTKFHALLIGVNCYLPNQMPGGGTYRNLRGCVRDIDHVEAYLRNALHVPPDHITRLTSTTGPGNNPVEPAAQLPSYENMVAAFKALAGKALDGDQVYVHYSGHGGRTTTAFPELKGAGNLDEALVPYDIGNSEARYLRDIELGALLKSIANKGAFLTVVLDSCHSGGATRGELAGVSTAVARGMDPGNAVKEGRTYDATDRPTESLVASHDELVAAWGPVEDGQRGVKPGSGWLQAVQGYTLLAACRANESAYEDVFEDGEKNGALTYWLLRSLPALPPSASFQVLHNILLARIRSWMGAQTPQLQGTSDRLVFGSENTAAAFGILVASVDMPNNTVLLNAGEAHGLRPGTLLAVYPNGAADLTSAQGRQAVLQVTELVGDADSKAVIVTDFNRGALEPGAQAVLIGSSDQRLQRTVALALNSQALLMAMQEALGAEGAGFVRLREAGEAADFQVGVVDDCYEIWDRSGNPMPNLRPLIGVSDADAAIRVVKRLVHLTKYENVRAIHNADPDMSKRVKVELLEAPTGDEGHAPVFLPGMHVTLRITNLLAPNLNDLNDPARILNVTVLQLANDYSIQQVHPPALEGPFVLLQPSKSIPLEFVTDLPAGCDEVTDILKVFVTQKSTDFRSLLLPGLDDPPKPVIRSVDKMDDPLERFLASFAGDEAPGDGELQTRLQQVSAPKQPRPWATSQVELTVKKA